MTRTDDLEAELRASWSDGALAVYADHLMSLDDPRGELISLELQNDRASLERRGELVRQLIPGEGFEVWLADDASTWCAGDRSERTWVVFEQGLIELVHISTDDDPAAASLITFLDHPISRFVHRVSIEAVALVHRVALGRLVTCERPWLRSLALRRIGDDTDLVIADTSDLVTAAPNLAQVELAGRRLMRRLDHAGVAELVLTGADAIQLPGWSMPGVTTLDLETRAGLVDVTAAQFPALRRLVLSRCEPGRQVFELLRGLDVAEQLAHLELPSLRSELDRTDVQVAIDRMPRLHEVHVGRSYMCFGDRVRDLRHPHARVTAAAQWPWPPRDQLRSERCLVDDTECNLGTLIELLEEQHDELDETVQAIWLRWWSMIDRNPRMGIFLATQLHAALDALVLEDPGWMAVRAQMLTAGDRYAQISAE